MTFDWTGFFSLAEKLFEDPQSPGPEEACLRSAVSRAYYAAFKVALEFAENTSEFEPTGYGSDHSSLPIHLQGDDDKDIRQLGVELRRLRDDRAQADYKDVLDQNPQKLAEKSVDTARNIINELGSSQAQ